jgi:hypothetical protein
MVKRLLSAAAITAILGSSVHAEPVATLSPAEFGDLHGCEASGDAMTLSVADGDREVFREIFCSAYGQGSVKTIRDAKGQVYVLLELAKGHGTNASTTYLEVYRLENSLIERRSIIISEPAGAETRWIYTYTVGTPAKGGLVLRMTLHLDGEGETMVSRPAGKKVIQVQ